MDELTFRARDRFHPDRYQLGVVVLVLVVQEVPVVLRFGVVGLCWVAGGTVVLGGLLLPMALRSVTTVGAAGVTVCRGFGRGRVHPWREIRWIAIRETKSQQGTVLTVRITLRNGRRRSLPALSHTPVYPNPAFRTDYWRVVNWWELCTAPADRFEPPKRARDRLSPRLTAFLATLLFFLVVGFVVALTN